MDVSHGAGMTGEPRDLPAAPGLPDTLSDVLEVVRLTGALFFLVDARTPWVAEAPASSDLAPVILPRAQHVVSYHVVTAGDVVHLRPWTPPGQNPGDESGYA